MWNLEIFFSHFLNEIGPVELMFVKYFRKERVKRVGFKETHVFVYVIPSNVKPPLEGKCFILISIEKESQKVQVT